MRFLKYWQSELDFDFHVATLNNESIIERCWLRKMVEQTVHQTYKGVLITADMGFGKSSFVSNLVCAEKWSSWYDLRQQILAYHFCRHDMAMSVTAHTFVRNLAGAIVERIPEMGNAIISDEIASKFLYGIYCEKDPVACLEMAILYPLRNRWSARQFIIIIDGLDECDTGAGNTLLELLYSQINAFPPNVKFILTSRNIEKIYKRFPEMTLLYLNSSNENNLEDIRQYIQHTIRRSGDKANTNDKISLSDKQIKTLSLVASGNFQHVKHYLQYCIRSGSCDFTHIPGSLEKLYQFNFERIFKDHNEIYDDLITVFEVLCTLQNPLSEDEIISIAQQNTNVTRTKLKQLLGNKLGHFIKIEAGRVSLLHKSISDFLTDISRSHLKFFIHKENGHKLFAEYLFKIYNVSAKTKQPKISDLAELVHHVSMSNNSAYESMLFQYLYTLRDINPLVQNHILYRVVHDYNNYHTVGLLLAYTHFKDVDARDVRNYSMAFVAAEQGNHESLKCLLDKKANASFRITFDETIDFSGEDLVRICKYIYFCGYNVLHIAAQNGHTKVVEVLLDRQEHLAYVETDMHLNAFHLAAENGHDEIVNMFLKRNSSFADRHALFQASKNGHITVVEALISHGVTDHCLPCNETMYWVPELSNRKQHIKEHTIRTFIYDFNTFQTSEAERETYFVDDWRLITCETALHAAVRNGHFHIVQILTKEETNALNCTTYDGKNPLMTAVQHNRTAIFKYLYHFYDVSTLKCKHSKRTTNELFLSKLDISEKVQLTEEMCPSGATIAHLLGIYDNMDIALYMLKSKFSEWYVTDTDQAATPLHYAFCHNALGLIILAQKLGLNFSVQASNGSTPFHSGAICRSLSLYIFTSSEKYNLNIPDALDNDGRSILHYSMILPLSEDYLLEKNETKTKDYWIIMEIFRISFTLKHNFSRTDNEGKNFLHYAADSGNYFGFIYSKDILSDDDFSMLMHQKDKTGKTPMDALFSAMSKHETFEALRIPVGCRIEDSFYSNCKTDYNLILTSHEMCIMWIAHYFHRNVGFANYNISNLLSISIRKSRLYPVLNLKAYANEIFENTVQTNPEILTAVTEYTSTNIAELILTKKNALKCDGKFSPLHIIIMNDKNAHWMHCSSEFLNKYLCGWTAQGLDVCFDSDGYNLLHRALMGGNIIATKYLLLMGMNINQLSRGGLSPLIISVTKVPFHDNGILPAYYTNRSSHQILHYVTKNENPTVLLQTGEFIDFDETSKYILQTLFQSKTFNRTSVIRCLCEYGERHLGLIHLAAAKGLIKFMKISRHLFGYDIINCHDFNNITPYFLAKIYNQKTVFKWLTYLKIYRIKPTLGAGSLLAYNVLFNYKTFHIFPWSCRLQYGPLYPGLILHQVLKCLNMLNGNDYSVLFNNTYYYKTFFVNYLQILNLSWSKLYQIVTLNIKLCKGKMDTECSKLKKLENVFRNALKRLHTYAYIFLRKCIVFGTYDRLFLFEMFSHHIFHEDWKKYVDELSFHSIFSFRFQYFEQLRIHNDFHAFFIAELALRLNGNHNFSSSDFKRRDFF